MQSTDVLRTLSEYLRVSDLHSFVQVNRRCRKAADRPEVWRSAFLEEFAGQLQLFGEPWQQRENLSVPWKRLSMRSIAVAGCWTNLEELLDHNGELKTAVYGSLLCPDMPMLALRREDDTMATFFLQLLAEANGLVKLNPWEESAISGSQLKALLDEKATELYQQVTDENEGEDLKAVCLNLDLGRSFWPKSIVLRLYATFKHTIALRCQTTTAQLSEAVSSLDLLIGYSQHWSAYCSSVQTLAGYFQCLLDVMMEMAEAKWPQAVAGRKLTVVEVMRAQWIQGVYAPLEAKIMQAAAALTSDCVSCNIKLSDARPQALRVLACDLMDISVPVEACREVCKLNFCPQGAYSTLTQNCSFFALSHLPKREQPLADFGESCESVRRYTDCVFYPCTAAQVEKLLIRLEVAHAKSYCIKSLQKVIYGQRSTTKLGTALGKLLRIRRTHQRQIEDILLRTDERSLEYLAALAERLSPEDEAKEDVYAEEGRRTAGLSQEVLNIIEGEIA